MRVLKRVTGIEPVYPAWKAGALADVLHPQIALPNISDLRARDITIACDFGPLSSPWERLCYAYLFI